MIRRAADMLHVLAVEPFGQVGRDVAGAVVGEKPWPVDDLPALKKNFRKDIERVLDVAAITFLEVCCDECVMDFVRRPRPLHIG